MTAGGAGAWAHGPDATATTGNRWPGRRGALGIVVLLLVAAMAAYLGVQRGELAYFRRLTLTVLLATLACQVLSQLFWNAAMLLPLRMYMTLGFWELFMVRAGGALVGYGVPIGGSIVVRLAYLKRRDLTYAQFTWATILSNVMSLTAAALLALAALGMLVMVTGQLSAAAAGLTGLIAVLALGGLAALQFLPRVATHPRLQRWNWLHGPARHAPGHGAMFAMLAYALGRHVFNFLSFGLLYQTLSETGGGFWAGGLVYAITSPLRMVTITPGNLGVLEWGTAAVGRLLSFDLTTGLIVALVVRAMTLAAQALGALGSAAWFAVRGEA